MPITPLAQYSEALTQESVSLESTLMTGLTNDWFGMHTSMQGDVAIVGAPKSTAVIGRRGVVYFYARTPSGWALQTRASAPEAGITYFGLRTALDGNTSVVSALGAVFVLERDATGWHASARLVPSDGGHIGPDNLEQFGASVAIAGDVIVVGSSSSAGCAASYPSRCYADRVYVYERIGGQWQETAILRASDTTGSGRERFGFSVVVAGNRIAIGAPLTGAEYLFEKVDGTWTQTARLLPTGTRRAFGSAAALQGDTLVVGDLLDSPISSLSYAGSAHVFVRSVDGQWLVQAKLSAPSPRTLNYFSTSLALDGDLLLAGAPHYLPGEGRVHAFERTGTSWAPVAVIPSAAGTDATAFGTAVAMSQGRFIASSFEGIGEAEIYRLAPPPPPDTDQDGVVDPADNCPATPNEDQVDQDLDGLGDACDADRDGDGVANETDNCADLENAAQDDADGDGLGDLCDNDDDNDLVSDTGDNCPWVENSSQSDNDLDGQGDACDFDDDNDEIDDPLDNCAFEPNPSQSDVDNDGLGDLCDADADGDGVANDIDRCAETGRSTPVDSQGCSGQQRVEFECPRDVFANHGQYVSCVARAGKAARDDGLLTNQERARVVAKAAKSQ